MSANRNPSDSTLPAAADGGFEPLSMRMWPSGVVTRNWAMPLLST